MLRLSLGLLPLLLLLHKGRAMLSGWVESPGYPHGYRAHARFNWSRCAPSGHTVSLTLTHLDLEDSHDCEHDALEIFSNRNLITILCGQMDLEELESRVNPSLLSTPGECLSLAFRSDYSNVKMHTGFRGFYTLQDVDECEDDSEMSCSHYCHNFIGGYHCSCRPGYHLDADKHTCTVSCSEDLSGSKRGVISSPSRPASYPENARCSYTLSVPDHLQLELHFVKEFDVEQTPDGQCIDSVIIETPSRKFGPYCGKVPPPSPLLTLSNHIRILFNSDGDGSNNGFTVSYKTKDQVCPGFMTSNSNVAPQKPEYHAGDRVTVSCDIGFIPDTVEETLGPFQYVTTCHKTGKWSPIYNCERLDCDMPDFTEDGPLQLVDPDDINTLFGDQIQFECISKYYTMKGNDTYICNATGGWESVDGNKGWPKCTEVCGKTETDIQSSERILGGANAELGHIPWQLFTSLIGNVPAGASLINDRWAVTAAHVARSMPLHLYGGFVENKKRSNTVVMKIEKTITHPDYNHATTYYDNDIALFKLSSRVELGPTILPICLPEPGGGLQENELGTVSGWGMTDTSARSERLQYVHIAGLSRSLCEDTPRFNQQHHVFTKNMICAGKEGKDSCVGDSGGPFFTPMIGMGNKNNRGPYRLRGIVSWGAPCQNVNKDKKGYYTKVENYLDWIKATIEKE